MKISNLYALFLSFIIYGCGSYYYQVQEISKTENSNNDDNFQFRNNDLTIDYDFWSSNGYTDMKIYNNTDSIIVINMELSHFIINNQAYPYFNNKEMLKTSSLKTTTNGSILNTSISNFEGSRFIEPKTIVLPPKTFKLFSGFNISKLYLDCDLKRYEDSTSMLFNLNTTPFLFTNLFYYSKGIEDKNQLVFKNNFFISKVINMIENKFITLGYSYNCGEPVSFYRTTYYSNLKSSNRFYIKYP